MKRRRFLKMLGLGVPTLALTGMTGCSKAHRRKPNIIFFLVDDLGWRDCACFGSPFYETPHIDRLAEEGMRFTDAYAACPVCSPTRASIMTGKYPARLGTTDWFGAPQPHNAENHWTRNKSLLPAPYLDHMPLGEKTVAEVFREADYRTFFGGKWHLGGEGYLPEDQGFDINKGGHHRGSPPGGYFSPYENPKLEDGPEGEHLPARLADESIRFIEKNQNGPFFLYLSFYSVHTPLQGRQDLVMKYREKAKHVRQDGPRFIPEGERQARQVQDHAVYGGMVEAMDRSIGRVLDTVDRLGLVDDTAIVFMSDNGGLSTSEGSPTSNVPLRAGKGWLYEGGIREPMIVKWPGVIKWGSICSEPVISTDFYPTLLEMAGLHPEAEQHVDGISLVPLLKQTDRPDREALYWHYPHWGNQGGSPSGAIRAGDWKLIEFFVDDRLELYNLREDIGEKHNRVDQYPEVVSRLHRMLQNWRREVDAKMPTPKAKK